MPPGGGEEVVGEVRLNSVPYSGWRVLIKRADVGAAIYINKRHRGRYRLGDSRFRAYVVRAVRLDETHWEVAVNPL